MCKSKLFNMFSYEEFKVKGYLSLFIKKLWILDNYSNPNTIPDKFVLPNACFNICFIFGQGLTVKHLNQEIQLTSGVYIQGQLTESLKVTIKPNTRATMAQFYPYAPAYFTDIDFQKLTNRIVPLQQFLSLPTEVKMMSNWEIIVFLIKIFRPRFHSTSASDLVFCAASQILNSNGEVPVAKVARDLGCSTRYLQKLFSFSIGLSPKRLCSIVKFRNTVDCIAYPEQEQSFTELALSRHYYDQAHFNRSFKDIVKISPKRFEPKDFLLAFKS